MVSTESTIEQPSTSNTDRQRLLILLDRQEVIDELGKYGISKVEAVARINSLSDEEVTALVAEIDRLPAGGYGQGLGGGVVIGMALLIYFLAVFSKGFLCIFFGFTGLSDTLAEECGLSYIFRLPWKERSGAQCYSRCNSIAYECINYDSKSVEEDCDPGMESCADYAQKKIEKSESQCKDEKQACIQQCEVEEEKEEVLREMLRKEEADCDPGMESCIFGGGGSDYHNQTTIQKETTEELDIQVCRFDCDASENVCLDSISEDEDVPKAKLQCWKLRNICSQQCESN
jgi:hypothetical protein